MKMQNIEIESFVNFLMGIELGGKQSRMRTRFCKLASERIRLIEEERVALARQFAQKNDDNEPVVETLENGGSRYVLADMGGFNREYQTLMLEDFIIEETADRKEMFEIVRDITLDTDMVFKGEAALQYDRYCEICERVD